MNVVVCHLSNAVPEKKHCLNVCTPMNVMMASPTDTDTTEGALDLSSTNECTATTTTASADEVEMVAATVTPDQPNPKASVIDDDDANNVSNPVHTSVIMNAAQFTNGGAGGDDNEPMNKCNNDDEASNVDDDSQIHSPEPEDLTIDEKDYRSIDDNDDMMVIEEEEETAKPVSTSTPSSPTPPASPPTDNDNASPTNRSNPRSPTPPPPPVEDDVDGDLQIDESLASIPMRRESTMSIDDNGGVDVDTEADGDVDMYGDIVEPHKENTSQSQPPPPPPLPPVEQVSTPKSPPENNIETPASPPAELEESVEISSPPARAPSPSQANDESFNTDKNEDSSQGDEDAPQSPPASSQSQSDGIIGTPVSFAEEESQSQTSPPPPTTKKKMEKVSLKKQEDELEEGEDMEEGEIMDEEEEEGEEPPKKEEVKVKAPKRKESTSSRESKESKGRAKGKGKPSSSSSSEKKKGREESDPVKRLLAEVREKDNKEKEEREKRRQEKKRGHKEDRDRDTSGKKNKKRRLSEEEEGEEFILVRGISPGGGGGVVGDNWDGPEADRRNKRRRDSGEAGSSPSQKHRGGHEEGKASPRTRVGADKPKGRPEPMRREAPRSEVICAYYMQGKCQKSADQCNYSHDAVPPRKMELCKFWMMECCAKKEKCLYLHNDFPCKYFHTGLVCHMGDDCKFSHDALSDGTKQVLLKHIETAPKEILGDFPRLNRTGALNLINKMEAKLKGLPYEEEENDENDETNMPPHPGHMHHGHGRGPGHGFRQDRHGPPDRHGMDRHGGPMDRHHHERGGRDGRGHFGGPGHHDGGRGRHGHDRGGGGDMGMGMGMGGPPDHRQQHDRMDRRQTRWESSQPTQDDQEKLQELMSEAGISGYYKETMNPDSRPTQGGQGSGGQGPNVPTTQSQMFPSQFQNPLMPLLPSLLPQMSGLPQVNNPALASVLASLNIPSSTIAASFPPPGSPKDKDGKTEPTGDGYSSNIPENLPKMQRELFERIQLQQMKNQNKPPVAVKAEVEEPEENWYSDEEEEDSKKKDELKAEINDQISSVLNQIRQQSQQSKEPESLKTFFGDTDLRAGASSSADFKDVDLRTSSSSSIFKKINILPATEINASISSHSPMSYKVLIVDGLREKPDYSQVRHTLTTQAILLDPRLGPKQRRSNSIPAPESPTDQSSEGLNQPMNIPDVTPIFDPRTMKGSGQIPPLGSGRGLLETPNPFMQDNNSLPGMNMHMNNMNDYNPFNRDPRSQSSHNAPVSQPPPNAAAQLQNFAAALMQQQWPGGQPPPIDPNLLMLAGFPFLPPPQNQGSGGGGHSNNPTVDFNMMQGGGGPGGMRMRPPFGMHGNAPPPNHNHNHNQAPPASSWERFNRGQGNLSPPL